MNKKFITLHGVVFNTESITQKLTESLPEWEKDIFLFLNEWFSEEPFVEVQTSGSTGTPKQIRRNKTAMLASAKMTGEFFSFSTGQKVLLSLPAKYIAGKMMLVRAIQWNLNLFYTEPKLSLIIPKQPFVFGAMTPQQISNNLQHIEGIKTIIIGGAPISATLEEQLVELPNTFFATYGMTETVSHVALRKLSKGKELPYTVIPGTKISINKDSCLIIKAPTIINTPLATNDIVELVGTDSFYWKGRKDFIINSGGVKLHPEKLEQKISLLLDTEYFFIGTEDPNWGQVPLLVIEGKEFNTEQLKVKLHQFLLKIERPKKIVFVKKFTRTANGKLNRKATIQHIK